MRSRFGNALSTISVFALFIVLTASIIAIGITLAAPITWTGAAKAELHAEQIVVQPGDTLWSIAKAQAPEIDPRDVIGEILELNGLSSAQIFPGQVLSVPLKQQYEPLQLAESRGRKNH